MLPPSTTRQYTPSVSLAFLVHLPFTCFLRQPTPCRLQFKTPSASSHAFLACRHRIRCQSQVPSPFSLMLHQPRPPFPVYCFLRILATDYAPVSSLAFLIYLYRIHDVDDVCRVCSLCRYAASATRLPFSFLRTLLTTNNTLSVSSLFLCCIYNVDHLPRVSSLPVSSSF
jgi:hypothetical protein